MVLFIRSISYWIDQFHDLNLFLANAPIYAPWKQQKSFGFADVSGGLKH